VEDTRTFEQSRNKKESFINVTKRGNSDKNYNLQVQEIEINSLTSRGLSVLHPLQSQSRLYKSFCPSPIHSCWWLVDGSPAIDDFYHHGKVKIFALSEKSCFTTSENLILLASRHNIGGHRARTL